MVRVQKCDVFNASLWAKIIPVLEFTTAYDDRAIEYDVFSSSTIRAERKPIFTYTPNNDYNQRAYDIILNLSSL